MFSIITDIIILLRVQIAWLQNKIIIFIFVIQLNILNIKYDIIKLNKVPPQFFNELSV